MKNSRAATLRFVRILLAASTLLGVCVAAYGVHHLRAAQRINFELDEKLLATLRSRGMSQATYKAALDMAEKDVEERKLMVDLAMAHARVSLANGAAFFVLAIGTWAMLRRLD